MKSIVWVAGLVAAFLWSSNWATAAIVVYTGTDNGVNAGSPRPNSNAAAASFDAAAASLGTLNQITFESLAIGYHSSFVAAPDVTVTLTGLASGSGIRTGNDAITGFNTTTGGSKYLYVDPAGTINTPTSVNFAFATPISAFGAYLTGVGTSSGILHAAFSDGTSHDYTISGSSMGGVLFWGITDAGASISSIMLQQTAPGGFVGDIYGIDDVRFLIPSANNVPEPSTLALGASLLGTLGMGWVLRRRRA